VILDSFALPDRLASVKVDANGVKEGEDRDDGEGACGDERDGSWLRAKIEESGCDGANIDGKLEL
jgi:hypothetical protein